MRTLSLFLLVPALLMAASSTASAAFSFQLVPASSNVLIGGSQILTVIATDTTAGGFGTNFTMSSVTTPPSGSGNITFTAFPAFVPGPGGGATVFVATTTGNSIGTITANVSPTAATGDTASITFNGTLASNSAALANILYTSNSATVTAVPEPTSLALVGLGGLGYAAYRRRRAAKA